MFATAVRMLAKKSKAKKASELASLKIQIGNEEQQWSGILREILKQQGPLTAGSLWEHAQDSGITSKKHMKMILKWMRVQNDVKLIWNRQGDAMSPASNEFLYTHVVPRSEQIKLDNAQEAKEIEDAPKPKP